MLNSKTNAAKRVSAFLLAALMLVGTLPLNVLAEGMQNKANNTVVADSKPEKDPTTGSKKHTVRFNANGGSGEMKDVEVAEGETYSLPKNQFKASEGKEFKNWIIEKDEFKEGHKLVVKKDLEVKANWADIKASPIKKVFSSLFEKNDSGLEISDATVPKAVMAGDNTTEGDPEGTVTSKDGKTRITMFDVSWVGTNERTMINEVDKHSYQKFQAEVKWAISGEREYKPGTVRINMTNKVFIGEKQKYHFYPDFNNMPVPKAILKEDGSINFDANYQKSDFVYVENNDNTISLVNVITLQPGNHGNYTITYRDYRFNDSLYEFDSGDIGNLDSSISIVLENNEVVNKPSKNLYIKAIKESGLELRKESAVFEDWPVTNVKAPENSKDYIYVVYHVSVSPSSYYKYNLELSDLIENPQELVGYSKPCAKEYSSNYRYYVSKDDLNKKITEEAFITSKDSSIKLSLNGVLGNGIKQGKLYDTDEYYLTNIYGFYIITRVPKSKVSSGEKFTFKNTVNATATTIEKESKTLQRSASTSVDYQYVKFVAPDNSFQFSKYDQNFHQKEKRYEGAINRLLGGVEENNLKSDLEATSIAMNLTYDANAGAPDNEDAYGKKMYKQVLTDDYLFLEGDSDAPLNNKDVEIDNIVASVGYREYKRNTTGYEWKRNSADTKEEKARLKNTIYGKQTENGPWVKLVEFNGGGPAPENLKFLHDEIKEINSADRIYFKEGSGFIKIKLETETSFPGLSQGMEVRHAAKPSQRIKDYIQKRVANNEDPVIRNIGTMSVYDSDGNLVGIRGKNNDKPIPELDKKEYGEEMYHDHFRFILKEGKKYSNIEKRGHSNNDASKKQFNTSWKIEAREETEGLPLASFKGLTSGTFYDLLPKGTTVDVSTIKVTSLSVTKKEDINRKISFYDMARLPITYKIIPNYKNSGQDLLTVSYSGYLNKEWMKDWRDYGHLSTFVYLEYNTSYSWDSYKDYGPKLRNLIAFESGNGEIGTGYKDDPLNYNDKWIQGGLHRNLEKDEKYTDEEKEIMKNLNPDHDNPAFIYTAANSKAIGNTIASTGLSKHVKGPQDIRYTTKTKVKEGDSYSYRLRLASQLGTSTSNIILYDTIEDYTLLKSDEDYGIKSWKGALESIDVSQPEFKGIDPVIYYSTVPNLKIRKPDPKSSVPVEQQENTVNLSDTSIWTKEKPADLSKVTAIAVDLSKDKKGQPYVLKENESVVVNLHMKAPWNMKEHNIGTTDKAINEIYANTTVTTNLDSKSENELINTAYTAVGLEPVTTEAPIKATKKHLDKEGKDIALKANEFTFELQDSTGKVLQTKTNDEKGNISFDPIKYNSWDVGDYTYKIVEVKGESDTTAYDNHEEIVKVKVERSGDSELKATITYDEDGALFTNREMDPIGTTIEAKKVYIGKGGLEEKPKAGAFEFILKDAQGNEVDKTTNDAEGKVTFKELTYKPNQRGEHKYTIEEVKGNNPAIDYDTTKKNVTVNVSLTEDFKLKADVVYEGGTTPTFTNTLKSASLQLVKLKDESDPFTLDEVKDANGFVTSYKVPEAQKGNVLDGAEYKLFKIESDGTETFIDTLITKSGISQVVQDILPGKYKLKETKAPEGYMLSVEPLEFEITEKDAGTIVAKFATDDKIVDMPSTGGQGTEAFMIGGGILLMTMAGAFYVANRKKEQRSK